MRVMFFLAFSCKNIQGVVNNIVELDSYSRTYAYDPSPLLPILALYDFGSAFPSLVQE